MWSACQFVPLHTQVPGYTQVLLGEPLEVGGGHIALLSAGTSAHPRPTSKVSLCHNHLLTLLKIQVLDF